MALSFLLLSIIGFLILSAFFSSSETAFFSLNKIQLKKLEKLNSRSSRRIFRLLRKPRELLIIILLGNTLVNVAASSMAAIIVIKLTENIWQAKATPLVMFMEIILMTIILLIFGEITPKLFAYSSPEKVAHFSSFFLVLINILLWPLIKILDFISSLFSPASQSSSNSNLTSEDFKNLINSKATETSLEETEKRIIASIFRFSSILAKDIMIPRVDIVALENSEGLKKLIKIIIESGHSKIPIYKKNIDNIIGIVYAKDVILQPEKKTINSLLRPCLFVTENVKIQNLLNQFKTKKIQIAVVVDEYGGTSGLITLEDILEELVGEIQDEYDTEKPMLSALSDREFLVSGMLTIPELNREFKLKLDAEQYDNLAEFLYDKLNRVPVMNDKYTFENRIEFTVTNIDGQRINYVKVRLLEKPSETD